MRKSIKKSLKYISIVIVVVLLLSVSRYSWRTFVSNSKFEDAHGGVWVGRWDSEGLGDGGDLKLKLSFIECDKYETTWMADHYGVFRSTIDTHMLIEIDQDKPEEYILSGSVDLGMEGVHQYKGRIVDGVMTLRWESAADHGRLKLIRRNAATWPLAGMPDR